MEPNEPDYYVSYNIFYSLSGFILIMQRSVDLKRGRIVKLLRRGLLYEIRFRKSLLHLLRPCGFRVATQATVQQFKLGHPNRWPNG